MEYGTKDYEQIDAPESGDAEFALKKANIFYASAFFVVAVLCLIILNVKNDFLTKITKIEGDTKFAIGCSFTYRVSAALCLWYLLHALASIGTPNLTDSCQFMIHISWMSLHGLLLVLLIVGSMFLPEKFTKVFFIISIVVSAIYLIFQLLSLIDLFFTLNDKCLEDENLKLPIVLFIIFLIVTIGLFVACFIFFKCGGALAITVVNLVLCVVLVAGAAFIEGRSILTASMVTMYIGYLTFTGLMADTSCSELSTKSSGLVFQIFSCIFTISWLVYSAFSLSGQLDICSCSDGGFSLSFFHSVFAMASPYLAMVVTNWGQASEGQWKTGYGTYSKWAVIASSWASFLLYGWSVIAPLVFPDRDFE